MSMGFAGYVRFRVLPPDTGEFMNRLRDSDFPVQSVRVEKGKYISGDIHWYSLEKLKKLAAECSSQLETVSRRGLIFSLMVHRRRTGFLAGALLAAAMVFWLSNTVLKIEVRGNESMSDREIISVLNDYGISIGSFIPALDLRESERQIITALDSIGWIGIRSSGCRILVEVSEMTKAPEMVPSSVPCNVISAKDAQIVGIKNVYMGMLVPMLYDGVKKGDLLISGTVKGKLDHDYYVHAMGEITGRYNETQTFFQPYEDSVINYSVPIERKYLYLFGLRVPLHINRRIKGEYEYSEKTEYFTLFDLSLPVGTVKAEFRPYTEDEIIYTREQAEYILIEKVKNYERNFFDNGEETIIDRKIDFTEKNNGIEASVSYILEGNIGVTQEIMAKY